jgi:hypothetical protein
MSFNFTPPPQYKWENTATMYAGGRYMSAFLATFYQTNAILAF